MSGLLKYYDDGEWKLVGQPDSDTLKIMMNEAAWPVGSVYTNATDPTNPAELLGVGTWEAVTDRFIYGAGSKTAGTTGGAETHTLSLSEIPSHEHRQNFAYQSSNTSSSETRHMGVANASNSGGGKVFNGNVISRSSTDYIYTDPVGSGQPHNNMPPYEVMYMWKRIA